MADFCQECSEELFGPGHNDFYGYCKPGYLAKVLCESCGVIYVDSEGKRVIIIDNKGKRK